MIRYEGPKGGPGMREMFKAMKLIYGRGLALKTALVTDGRFSGTNNGCFVGHISPEAAERGALAVVRNGDPIHIDIPARSLNLGVDRGEVERRLAELPTWEPSVSSGYLRRYAQAVTSACTGAVFR